MISTTLKTSIAGSLLSFAVAASAQLLNPGFELAGSTEALAANWTVTQAVGGPVYAMRTNATPHGGSYAFEVHLASTGAGPVVEFVQGGIPVVGGTNYPFTFYAKALSGSAGYNAQWRIVWNAGGETGFHGYAPGNNSYSWISNSIAVPASATSASLYFYFAGAASPSLAATIQLDDVTFGASDEVVVDPGTTNPVTASISRGTAVRWFASNSVTYQVQWATALLGTNTVWNNLGDLVNGNGATNTVVDTFGPPHNHFRVLSIQ